MFLQHPQQFGLKLKRNVSYFIEEQSALVGNLEAARLPHDGAGKCAPFMAEEFALNQAGGNRCAVEFDKGPIPPRTQVVDCPGDQLFSGSRLTEDQYAGIGRRHNLDVPEGSLERRASAHDACEDLFSAVLLFPGRTIDAQCCVYVIYCAGLGFGMLAWMSQWHLR
jgi:hypothetical protein